MPTKTCTKCKEARCLSVFHKDKNRKDGLAPWCKVCVKANSAKWRSENREKDKLSSSEYYYANRDKRLAYQRVQGQKYKKENPALNAASSRAYNARKCGAEPKWLSDCQKAHIKRTYKLSKLMSEIVGEQYHVDHIVPLKGENVCGLHVPWNLSVVPAEVNLKKSNTFEGW